MKKHYIHIISDHLGKQSGASMSQEHLIPTKASWYYISDKGSAQSSDGALSLCLTFDNENSSI